MGMSFNPQVFEQAWDRFGSEDFDVVIIGGGSVGAGAALDAATRGLRTAVVETRDFAAGTSSRSSKMFHGGLRYLAMLDFKLVAESLHERELNMSVLAPHLVKPLKFIFPLTHRLWERVMMFGGFALYDLMGGAKSVPMQKHLTRGGVLKAAPGLRNDAIVGGVRYYDTLVDDARHTMMVLRTAAHYGAVVRPSTQVVGFDKDASGRIVAAQVRDTDTGEVTTIRGKVFINATGVWNDEVEKLAGARGKFSVHASKGIHIVVEKDKLDADAALCFVTEKSVLFVIPWGNYWIIGTTDTDWDQKLSKPDPAPTRADIDYVLSQVNQRVNRKLGYEDIVGVFSGLRPLLSGKSDATTNLSRNHAVAVVTPGLVSVAGGKYTTYRVIGKDAVDVALKEAKITAPESVTERTPIVGADGYHALVNQVSLLAAKYGVDEQLITHMLGRYGSLCEQVLAPGLEDPQLLTPVEGAEGYCWAEVLYAVTDEGALHVEDVLLRRLRVGMEYADRGVGAVDGVARRIAPYLGWDETRVEEEISGFVDRVNAELAAEKALTDVEANTIMTTATQTRSKVNLDVEG
ncbi:glycerol-3-phosphate dehydrogenase/oxidase [Corynebacterium pseudotuberculosis]|uniref:Glycerol-3-phosphate dehydrogenase n=1 Tax=Corynebacterium pseudotuberculosis (strain C231) TaxID=681645 RepID=D9QCN8_CORP2|nr:glycerol-3-phosphate dehydrogenase/oxidase [Corynebacterium pseudotuberculosis]ADK29661.1 FAD-dependent oxidoreductase [Corynebacterium pseudotuberculosis FRC41]ADL11314.1 FAD-dependent oxidoreductase [Corynebacterium pseudotuberculosis C231]ADL21727.1 glycerol-3-phosphate dehydrogenase/oxidase [Corynebacterium pseudotuberculosis 1002]ADO27123.1 FAD-dependent oxidoreductase [Corynebacterium pseudotuberculosis I19]AEK93187.1 Glycerol-3-phosphate dehydrogenase [Corynebacterium pseudotuberculo